MYSNRSFSTQSPVSSNPVSDLKNPPFTAYFPLNHSRFLAAFQKACPTNIFAFRATALGSVSRLSLFQLESPSSDTRAALVSPLPHASSLPHVPLLLFETLCLITASPPLFIPSISRISSPCLPVTYSILISVCLYLGAPLCTWPLSQNPFLNSHGLISVPRHAS
jgi:hypothetical protein